MVLEKRSSGRKEESWRRRSTSWLTACHHEANDARFRWFGGGDGRSETGHVEFQLSVCYREHGRGFQSDQTYQKVSRDVSREPLRKIHM